MSYKGSNTLQKLIFNGYGWRNDKVYGSGIVDFKDIISYEVFELGNIDILETSRKLYSLKLDLRRKKESIKIVLEFFKSYFNSEILFALWLTTKEAVIEFYEGNNSISKYKVHENYLVASDLDVDGILFVSDRPFEKL